MGLVIAEPAVGQDDAPHDLGKHHLLPQVVLRSDEASKLEVIQGLGSLGLSQTQEFLARRLVQSEVPHQRSFDVLPLRSTELAIGVSQLE
jgi:hypothetical protein